MSGPLMHYCVKDKFFGGSKLSSGEVPVWNFFIYFIFVILKLQSF